MYTYTKSQAMYLIYDSHYCLMYESLLPDLQQQIHILKLTKVENNSSSKFKILDRRCSFLVNYNVPYLMSLNTLWNVLV